MKMSKNKTAKKDIVFYVGLGIISIVALLIWRFINVNSGIQDLVNVDDLCSIQFAMAGDGMVDKIYGIIKNDPTNPPIFYILLYVWIKLFGYTPSIIRLLPEIIAAISVFFIGIVGKKVKDEKLGWISAILTATSIQSVYASFQIRAYSLMILGAAILFLAWLYRNEKWTTQLIYVLALWLLSFTHFFGVLLCFAFGLWDLRKVIKKEEKMLNLIPYVVYCLVYVPYLVVAFVLANELYGAFWPPKPEYLDILEMLEQLSPLENSGLLIFFIFFVLMVLNWRNSERYRINVEPAIKISVWNILVVLFIVFVYSRYVNPISSVWVYRYFLVLYPNLVVIISLGIYQCFDWFERNFKIDRAVIIAILISMGMVNSYQNVEYALEHKGTIALGGKKFKEVAECLSVKEDINLETTLVYFPYPKRYFDGWLEFYTQGDIASAPNMIWRVEQLRELDLDQYNTIYTVGIVYDVATQGQEYIDEKFTLEEENCDGIDLLDKYIRK